MNAGFPEVEGWFTSGWTLLHAVASSTSKTTVAVAKHLRSKRSGGSPTRIVRDIGYPSTSPAARRNPRHHTQKFYRPDCGRR
jgi:hypothetical protein